MTIFEANKTFKSQSHSYLLYRSCGVLNGIGSALLIEEYLWWLCEREHVCKPLL